MKLTLLLSIILLASCSNQGMYEAIQNNQCMEKTGKVYCDERGDNYNDYKRERDALLKSQK